jgi:hypothetical protein
VQEKKVFSVPGASNGVMISKLVFVFGLRKWIQYHIPRGIFGRFYYVLSSGSCSKLGMTGHMSDSRFLSIFRDSAGPAGRRARRSVAVCRYPIPRGLGITWN